ncbi:hypothetical protein [Aliamphritea ceti]|uniref:hypothetical protein n=1 Tax=Aliamphritea ceti TaxID=1524258 RepID=UPI0021C388B5|nr:hypothetical protein [Aliamphritea ceti]
MSSSSKQSSSSSQTTTNNTTNESLNASLSGDMETGSVAVAGDEIALTQHITDGGAFDVVKDALNGMGTLITELNENQAVVLGQANQLASTAIQNVASANGVEPIAPPMTEKTKIAIAVSAAVSVLGVAVAVVKSRG